MAAISFNIAIPIAIGSQKKNTMKTNEPVSSQKILITVGTETFAATFFDNETATAFKNLLPLTIEMTELNGNEKYYDFSNRLPQNASNPGQINSGDLMLYGSKTLVLFYKSFSTSYSYTRIGRIEDSSGLEQALGAGNKTVKFGLQ